MSGSSSGHVRMLKKSTDIRTKESHLYSKQILGHPFEAFAYVSFFVCVLHMIDATSDQCERLDNFLHIFIFAIA